MKCDFSLKHYRYILKSALKNGYKFIGFDELKKNPPPCRICILRHDVDYMPEWAEYKGRIDAQLGIRSTFFFQVQSATYNACNPGVRRIAHNLHNMGHSIGLHFDTSDSDVNLSNLAHSVRSGKNILKSATGITLCNIISFHNTHCFQDKVCGHRIKGIRHVYEKEYFKNIKYLSDSQGWYEGCPCKIFRSGKYPRIQLLTHPYIWDDEYPDDFIENVAHVIKLRSGFLFDYFIKWHPVCRKGRTRLEALLKE